MNQNQTNGKRARFIDTETGELVGKTALARAQAKAETEAGIDWRMLSDLEAIERSGGTPGGMIDGRLAGAGKWPALVRYLPDEQRLEVTDAGRHVLIEARLLLRGLEHSTRLSFAPDGSRGRRS